jgi:hypothetical protein
MVCRTADLMKILCGEVDRFPGAPQVPPQAMKPGSSLYRISVPMVLADISADEKTITTETIVEMSEKYPEEDDFLPIF